MQSPFIFLLDTVFNLYVMVILLRFLLQLFRADFYNPLSQFVVKVTNPVLVPMRKVIPGVGGVDVSSLVLALAIILLKFFILFTLSGRGINIGSLLIIGLTDLLNQGIYLVFWLVIIRAIMSWINPHFDNPFMMVIYQVTEPIMAPFRRIIPPMGGLDLSPIVLIIGLQFLIVVIESWLLYPLLTMMQ